MIAVCLSRRESTVCRFRIGTDHCIPVRLSCWPIFPQAAVPRWMFRFCAALLTLLTPRRVKKGHTQTGSLEARLKVQRHSPVRIEFNRMADLLQRIFSRKISLSFSLVCFFCPVVVAIWPHRSTLFDTETRRDSRGEKKEEQERTLMDFCHLILQILPLSYIPLLAFILNIEFVKWKRPNSIDLCRRSVMQNYSSAPFV